MEKLYETWKNLVATKNSPLIPRSGNPSIQFKIIFQKNFQPHYALQYTYISFDIY